MWHNQWIFRNWHIPLDEESSLLTTCAFFRVLLKHAVPSNTEQELHNSKQKQRLNHNQQLISRLNVPRPWNHLQDTTIWYTTDMDKFKARVEERLPYRSYRVKMEDGRVLRRNRRHLRVTKETFREAAPYKNLLRTGSRVKWLIERTPGQKEKNGTMNPSE